MTILMKIARILDFRIDFVPIDALISPLSSNPYHVP